MESTQKRAQFFNPMRRGASPDRDTPLAQMGGLPSRVKELLDPRSARDSGKLGRFVRESDELIYNGLPYRGPVLDYKNDDPEHLRPQLKQTAKVAQFDMNDDEQMLAYEQLVQKVCDGRAVVSSEDKVYEQSIGSWRILVRWTEPYYAPPYIPKESRDERQHANQNA